MEPREFGRQWAKKKLAVLRGDPISKGFFFSRKIMSAWAAKKKSGRNDKVTVLPWWP